MLEKARYIVVCANHNERFGIRYITPMECLVMQGFSTNFIFPFTVPLREQYKQAGNTVCIYNFYK